MDYKEKRKRFNPYAYQVGMCHSDLFYKCIELTYIGEGVAHDHLFSVQSSELQRFTFHSLGSPLLF